MGVGTLIKNYFSYKEDLCSQALSWDLKGRSSNSNALVKCSSSDEEDKLLSRRQQAHLTKINGCLVVNNVQEVDQFA